MLFPVNICRGGENNLELEKAFLSPPPAARPWVYWFWVHGNVTREGITADLEAMGKAGIGGVLIMEVIQAEPAGPVHRGSPEWFEMFKHACAEADRLGLDVNINNSTGYAYILVLDGANKAFIQLG
jgi:hypothetical protein